jgi:peptidoglycan hydrolase-like protein with peptidoglycan-binding domain
VVVLALGLVAALAAPVSAALTPSYPIQSLGDRGTDVAALQELFLYHQAGHGGASDRVVTGARNPIVVPVDGIFGTTTQAGIRGFQASRNLPENGIVDASTWDALVIPIGPGATGGAIRAVQRELREKRGATTVPIDGVYGTSTTAAVTAFQSHIGLPQTGAMNAATWRALVWHYEQPRFSASALCDYDVVSHNWGTAETVAALETAGSVMVQAGFGQIAVGDISLEHGGDTPLHAAHEVGLDADLRPMRRANDQCSHGSNWRLAAYDRSATRALINAIRAATPGHVKFILFNDPQLIAEGLTRSFVGHDDHLHVHFCEAGHPDRDYRC